jgi:hypothetical protein
LNKQRRSRRIVVSAFHWPVSCGQQRSLQNQISRFWLAPMVLPANFMRVSARLASFIIPA